MVGRLVHRWLHIALDATQGAAPSGQRRLDPRPHVGSAPAPAPRPKPACARGLPPPISRRRTAPPRRPSALVARRVAQGGLGDPRVVSKPWRKPAVPPAGRAALAVHEPDVSVPNSATGSGPLRLRAQCDVVLLDRPEFDGAACQLIDIRTGAAPTGSAPQRQTNWNGARACTRSPRCCSRWRPARNRKTAAPGSCIPMPATFALGRGPCPAGAAHAGRLARQQRTLVFGQKGALVNAHDPGQAEELAPGHHAGRTVGSGGESARSRRFEPFRRRRTATEKHLISHRIR